MQQCNCVFFNPFHLVLLCPRLSSFMSASLFLVTRFVRCCLLALLKQGGSFIFVYIFCLFLL